MDFPIWKLISTLSTVEALKLAALVGCAVFGACIALYIGIPLANEWLRQKTRHGRRRRAMHRWASRSAINRGGSVNRFDDTRPENSPSVLRTGWKVPLIVGCYALAVVLGLTLLLRGKPEPAAPYPVASQATYDPGRLRLEYELKRR